MEEFADGEGFDSDNEFEDDDLTDEENVERTFNFVSELSVLVDYDVISKYAFLLKHESIYSKRPLLMKACSSFFKRIISQTKQTWIFFQIETLSIFNDFVQKDVSNNSLMKGILEKKSTTQSGKQIETYKADVKSVITLITAKFTELIKKNKMLGVEILFRFPTREIKDQILSNYDGKSAAHIPSENKRQGRDDEIEEAVIDMNNFDHTANVLHIDNLRIDDDARDTTIQDEAGPLGLHELPDELGFKWTQEKDEILINNYPGFKDLGKKACYEMLHMLIPETTAKMCYHRGKKLGLKKLSAEESMQRSVKLLGEQQVQMSDKKVLFALQKFVLSKMEHNSVSSKGEVKEYIKYVDGICTDYQAFRQTEDNLVLFGDELELQDIKRQSMKNGNKNADARQM